MVLMFEAEAATDVRRGDPSVPAISARQSDPQIGVQPLIYDLD